MTPKRYRNTVLVPHFPQCEVPADKSRCTWRELHAYAARVVIVRVVFATRSL